MFPVPDHLARSPTAPNAAPETPGPDTVLDLLEPLFSSGSNLSSSKVGHVREQLQAAVSSSKKRGHDILVDNFAAVSSHVRLGHDLEKDFGRVQKTLQELEDIVYPSNEETSFLPPVLSLVYKHFQALQARSRAQSHIKALKNLQRYTERIEKLENAVWAGRGADDWVIGELTTEGHANSNEEDILTGTKALKAAKDRLGLFRSMITEQVSDAFGKAVSFTLAGNETLKVKVQSRTTLQQPRIPRADHVSGPSTSVPPPYSLEHIYSTLSALGALSQVLSNLRTKVIRDIVPPLVEGRSSLSIENSDALSTLHLRKPEDTPPPDAILHDIASLLDFISTTIFPSSSTPLPDREPFLAEINSSILDLVLENVVLTTMPSSLSSVPGWLETIHRTLEVEESHALPTQRAVIKPFFETKAGEAWAVQRRRRVGEDVRKLVVGGWGGWEAKEAEREKQVVMVVEVAVDEPPAKATNTRSSEQEKEEDSFGWGFDDDAKGSSTDISMKTAEDGGDSVDDGWGFDGDAEGDKRSSPAQSTQPPAKEDQPEERDGWDFDESTNLEPAPAPEPEPSPVKPIIAKPAREAKKLGKKVAKVKARAEDDDDDPWGSGTDLMACSEPTSVSASAPPPVPTLVEPNNSQDGGWGWDEPEETTAPAAQMTRGQVKEHREPLPERKRTELKEETRTIHETFLVSRACGKLVELADRVLKESRDLLSTDLPSPSFALAAEVLLAAATDVFDLYRSLLPSHFAPQLRDVPTLAMQVHNDAFHLSSQVDILKCSNPSWTSSADVSARLSSLGDHILESQLSVQRSNLFEILADVDRFRSLGTEAGEEKTAHAISSIVASLETVSHVLRVVLPTTTYHQVMGYLLDTLLHAIINDILDLNDITEIESERITNVLRPLRGLEELFVLEQGQPSTIVADVPHWLKFCYISELLQANLVDILYLFDSGALVDFSTRELVSLLRALFADSEKRDHAIERIESGTPGQRSAPASSVEGLGF